MKYKYLIAIVAVGIVATVAGLILVRSHGKTPVQNSALNSTSTCSAGGTSSCGMAGTANLHGELLAIENNLPTQTGKNNFLKQSSNLTQKVDPELVDLDGQIITCDPDISKLLSSSPSYGRSCVAGPGTVSSVQGKYLSGQCCSALMDTTDYHANLQKLQAYKNMPNIPLDPMHTPITMAKQWIDYDNTTTLNSAQQAVFDQAMTMSKESPCCCKCWHYFTNEGIAKKMIVDKTFNAQQIAAFWDASDICGA